MTARSNGRKPHLFRNDCDRRHFLELVGQAVRRYGWLITSWVLMSNHFHLVMETPDPTLSVAYWGQAGLISGDAGGVNMGPLPAAGSWARIEVPLSQLHLEGYTLIKMDINYRDGQVWFDRIGKSGSHPPAVITTFIADHASPQLSGTALTWAATATASIPPAQYRFERQDGGVWSVVQAYGSGSTYMWTPVAGDAGDHSVRVSVRNSGSIADFEDTRTMPITITTGSGTLVAPRREGVLARMFERTIGLMYDRMHPRRSALSFSVAARYASAAVGDVQRYSIYTPELNLMSETEATTSSTPAVGTTTSGSAGSRWPRWTWPRTPGRRWRPRGRTGPSPTTSAPRSCRPTTPAPSTGAPSTNPSARCTPSAPAPPVINRYASPARKPTPQTASGSTTSSAGTGQGGDGIRRGIR